MPDANDAGHDKSKGFINAVTNEYALFLYRFITGGCALLMTWWVLDLKIATQDVRRDLNAYQLLQEARISNVEGKVSVIDNAIRMQSKNLESHETTLQAIWSRLFDMNSRIK
jgi:hypothetical protein